MRLAQLLTQQHLEVQKAFAGLDQRRQGCLEPHQLVSFCCHAALHTPALLRIC